MLFTQPTCFKTGCVCVCPWVLVFVILDKKVRYSFFVFLRLISSIYFYLLVFIYDSVVGIKQVMFGGEEFENWKENLTSEDSGFSVHKI